MRALEQYVTAHRQDPAARFVLAYHYLVIDSRDAAANQFREVVKLQPSDRLSAVIAGALVKAQSEKPKKTP